MGKRTTRPHADHTPRADAETLEPVPELGKDIRPARTIAYVCGNPGMTGSASAAVAAWALPDEAVRSEAYWMAAAPS